MATHHGHRLFGHSWCPMWRDCRSSLSRMDTCYHSRDCVSLDISMNWNKKIRPRLVKCLNSWGCGRTSGFILRGWEWRWSAEACIPASCKHTLGFTEVDTPLKFNMEPENRQSQKETHLPTIIFRGYVKFRGCTWGCTFLGCYWTVRGWSSWMLHSVRKKTSSLMIICLGGGFKEKKCSPRKLGKIPNLTSIFMRWVGSTTN